MTRYDLAKRVLVLLIVTGIPSCGGDSSNGLAGIGGTGITASGAITGFGSVFVNGIEFETNNTTIIINEKGNLTESSLRIGMIVAIKGTINADGTTGTANDLVYDAELVGPVSTTPIANPDNSVKTFTILNSTIAINRTATEFSGDDFAGFSFDTIAQDDVVEVSGFIDNLGVLTATYVEKKSDDPINADVTIKGTISGSNSPGQFQLGALTVTWDDTTELSSDMPTDSNTWNGLQVEVEGILGSGGTTISATEIDIEENNFKPDDGDEIKLEGVVSDFLNIASFKVNGQLVDASTAEFSPTTLPDTLTNGVRIEVEGKISNGVLNAEDVESRN